jgi:hypothetical protein
VKENGKYRLKELRHGQAGSIHDTTVAVHEFFTTVLPKRIAEEFGLREAKLLDIVDKVVAQRNEEQTQKLLAAIQPRLAGHRLTVDDAVLILSKSREDVYRSIRKGELQEVTQYGDKGKMIDAASVLTKLLHSRRRETRPESDSQVLGKLRK